MLKFALSVALAKLTPPQRYDAIQQMISKGVSNSQINKIKNTREDDSFSPNLQHVEIICEVLGIAIEEFTLNKVAHD